MEKRKIITYLFKLDDGRSLTFAVDIDRPHHRTLTGQNSWTKLNYQQCPNCPLVDSGKNFCPVAVDVESIVEDFSSMISCDSAEVIVTTPERQYSKKCTIQGGLTSLLGLVMATSGCPVLSSLTGMAHFHLPFATIDETVTRTVSFFLLDQLYHTRKGGAGKFNLDSLKEFYRQLENINQAFFERIRAATTLDANLNAIVNFCAVSWIVSNNLDQILDRLESTVTSAQG
jgi:hypothetical protein